MKQAASGKLHCQKRRKFPLLFLSRSGTAKRTEGEGLRGRVDGNYALFRVWEISMHQAQQLYPVFLKPYSLFAVIIGLAYVVFLFRWGFYYDDWPDIYVFFNNLSVFDFYQFDRPIMAWTVFLLSRLAGTNPLAWQVLALLLRWALVSAFYWCFSLLWPKAKLAVLLAALFFAIHPAYSLQPIALTFSKVYLFYAVYFLSLGWMLKSLQAGKQAWIFSMLSLATMAYHVFSLEYFWGLELARPIVIWLALSRQALELRRRLRLTLQIAAPYLILILAAMIWRIWFATYPTDGFYFIPERNQPLVFLRSLVTDSQSLLFHSRKVLDDIRYLFVDSWNRASSTTISWQTKRRFFAIILGAFGLIFLFLRKSHSLYGNDETVWKEMREIFWFGLFVLIVGMLPVWSVGNHPSTSWLYDERHALAGLAGASLLLAGLIASLQVPTYRWGLFAVFMMLALWHQLQNGYGYYQDWRRQQGFFWQLHWRAPYLLPQTFIVSEHFFSGSAVAVLYGDRQDTTSPEHWAFVLTSLLNRYGSQRLLEGTEIDRAVRTLHFRSSSTRALSVHYPPGQRCLWVLTARDRAYPYWTEQQQLLVDLSAAEKVIAAQPVASPALEIFGPEPPHTWCYYFQKASLARQFEDWETVVALGETVFEKNLHPDDVYEWLPFLEGYLHLRRWEQANAIAEEIFRNNSEYRPAVCYLLKTVEKQASSSAKEQLQEFQELWGCTP